MGLRTVLFLSHLNNKNKQDKISADQKREQDKIAEEQRLQRIELEKIAAEQQKQAIAIKDTAVRDIWATGNTDQPLTDIQLKDVNNQIINRAVNVKITGGNIPEHILDMFGKLIMGKLLERLAIQYEFKTSNEQEFIFPSYLTDEQKSYVIKRATEIKKYNDEQQAKFDEREKQALIKYNEEKKKDKNKNIYLFIFISLVILVFIGAVISYSVFDYYYINKDLNDKMIMSI